jgi:hypothetical protein
LLRVLHYVGEGQEKHDLIKQKVRAGRKLVI